MPIQVTKNKYIEYRYDPDYLQSKKSRSIKTYPDIVCDCIGLNTIKSDMIIDGGNIIKSNNCAILTDKIVVENTEKYSTQALIEKLRELLEVDAISLDSEEIVALIDVNNSTD